MVRQEKTPLMASPDKEEPTDADSNMHHCSNGQSMMHVMKALVGSGAFALPYAVANAGLWTGTVGLVVMGLIAAHCLQLPVFSHNSLCRRTGISSLDYSGVMRYSMVTGSPTLARFSGVGVFLVDFFVCITQFGFCIVYVLFIAQNMRQAVIGLFDYDMEEIYYMLGTTLLLVPLILIKSLKKLAPFSMLANVLNMVGIVIVLQYCIRDLPPVSDYPVFKSWSTLPIYFGTAIYAFEGIGVVLPVQNKMCTPEDYPGPTGVLNTSINLVTLLYTAIGFYGYLKVGNAAKGSITLNLPTNNPLYISVKLMFSLSNYITYALQFYVPFQIIWPHIENRITSVSIHQKVLCQCAVRVLLVFVVFGVAATIPHLDLMISLVGALSSTAIALLFPPLIQIFVLWPHRNFGRWNWILCKDVLLILFSLLGFVSGTAVSLINIINAFGESSVR